VPPLGLPDGAAANGMKTSLSLPGVSACQSARLNRGFLLAALGPNCIRAYPLLCCYSVWECDFLIHCWETKNTTRPFFLFVFLVVAKKKVLENKQ